MKKIYHYDEKTGEFLYESNAVVDALETAKQDKAVYLLAANSTLTPPPAPKNGKAAIFDGAKWSYVDDYRGSVIYSTTTKQPKMIETLGELPTQEGYTALEPYEGAVWGGKRWIDDIEVLRAQKKAEIEAAKSAHENAPIEYEGMLFDADEKSKNNLTSAAVIAYKSRAKSMQWVTYDNQMVELTEAQLLGLAHAIATRDTAIVMRGRALKDAALHAKTKTEIENINWEENNG